MSRDTAFIPVVRGPRPDTQATQRLRLGGRLDVSTVSAARVRLHEAVDTGTGDLVVDLTGLELGDATGLGALLGAHRRAQRAGRRLVLVGVPATIARQLAYTRLNRVLRVLPGVA